MGRIHLSVREITIRIGARQVEYDCSSLQGATAWVLPQVIHAEVTEMLKEVQSVLKESQSELKQSLAAEVKEMVQSALKESLAAEVKEMVQSALKESLAAAKSSSADPAAAQEFAAELGNAEVNTKSKEFAAMSSELSSNASALQELLDEADPLVTQARRAMDNFSALLQRHTEDGASKAAGSIVIDLSANSVKVMS
jgi:hypothetical protein